MAVSTPRSALTRASSSSSRVPASSLRLTKRPVTLSLRLEEVRRIPSLSRPHQLRVAPATPERRCSARLGAARFGRCALGRLKVGPGEFRRQLCGRRQVRGGRRRGRSGLCDLARRRRGREIRRAFAPGCRDVGGFTCPGGCGRLVRLLPEQSREEARSVGSGISHRVYVNSVSRAGTPPGIDSRAAAVRPRLFATNDVFVRGGRRLAGDPYAAARDNRAISTSRPRPCWRMVSARSGRSASCRA